MPTGLPHASSSVSVSILHQKEKRPLIKRFGNMTSLNNKRARRQLTESKDPSVSKPDQLLKTREGEGERENIIDKFHAFQRYKYE